MREIDKILKGLARTTRMVQIATVIVCVIIVAKLVELISWFL